MAGERDSRRDQLCVRPGKRCPEPEPERELEPESEKVTAEQQGACREGPGCTWRTVGLGRPAALGSGPPVTRGAAPGILRIALRLAELVLPGPQCESLSGSQPESWGMGDRVPLPAASEPLYCLPSLGGLELAPSVISRLLYIT